MTIIQVILIAGCWFVAGLTWRRSPRKAEVPAITMTLYSLMKSVEANAKFAPDCTIRSSVPINFKGEDYAIIIERKPKEPVA